jgi:PKD repeat protein
MEKKIRNMSFVRVFSMLFILVFCAASVSALSLIAQYSDGTTQDEIMPGNSVSYNVMAVADQGLSQMKVKGVLYDMTTGEKVNLGTLFDESTVGTFFYPAPYQITAQNYKNLPGTYLITITAEEWLTNGIHKTSTTSINLEVIGNRLPVADFVYDPSSPTTDVSVTLTSTSYDTDGYIAKTEWLVDSVKIGEGTTLKHVFDKAGAYSVTVKVTDNEQGTASKTKTIYVKQGEPTGYPIADFIYSPISPEANQKVTFTSKSYDSNGYITLEEWDFENDGVFDTTGKVSTHTYAREGTYKVTLRVTDNSGLKATVTKEIVVREAANVPPVADFTYNPMNPIEKEMVTFNSASYDSDGTIEAYAWYIDGQKVGSDSTMTNTFDRAGTYTVMLTVTDNDGASSSKTKSVVVRQLPNNAPVADFTYSPMKPIVNDVVTFTSTSYDSDGYIASLTWYIDGIFAGSGKTMTHTFTREGIYNVKIIVTDDDGAQDTEIKSVAVACLPNVAPVADFTYSPSSPKANELVTFTSTSYDSDGYIASYAWYIDGTYVGNNKVMTHTFTCDGTYTVKLTVTDDDNAQDSESKSVVVGCAPVPNNAPVADFVYSPMNPKENDRVTFTSTSRDSDGYIASQVWYVDGVQVSTSKEMNRIFTTAGTYNVKLTVFDDDGAQDSETKQIVVMCLPNVAPVADFTYSPSSPKANELVTFTSTSYDSDGTIVSYAWYIDGTYVGNNKVMTHTFTCEGTYTVKLTVTDDDNAQGSKTKSIVVGCAPVPNNAPVADFVYSPLNPKANDLVTFTSTSYDSDGTIVSYKWYIDGSQVGTDKVMKHTFTCDGTYTVKLTVTDDDGAQDSESKQIVVGCEPIPNNAPVADFVYSPLNPKENELVTFTSTSYDSDGTIVSYKWYIDGSQVGTDKVMRHTFTCDGTYTVKLTVTDDDNAQDSESKSVVVGCAPVPNNAPVADFVYSPLNPKENDRVTFTSTSYDTDGTIVSQTWYIDGAQVSTSKEMSHVFTTAGVYSVKLTVVDDDGAVDSETKQIVVTCLPNAAPVADFIYTPLNITVNQMVRFTSTSYDTDGTIISYAWYIDGVYAGNGNEITKTFSTSGIHSVRLTVVDDDGASDSETKQIFVGCAPNIAPVADFTYEPSDILVNHTVTFTSTSHDADGNIVSYKWTIDDVSVGHSEVMSRKFMAAGTYKITLTVIDDDGASNSKTKFIVVNRLPNVGPVANFEYEPFEPITGEEATFTSTSYDSDGYIVSYEWYVDDKLVADTANMKYVFTTAGDHSVLLKVTDNDGASDTALTNLVVVQKIVCTPNAVLRMPESVTENKVVKMDGSKSTASCNHTLVTYRWQIYKKGSLVGDFHTTLPYASYTFSHGEYKVVLTVYDNEGLTDSDEKIVFAGTAKKGIVIGSEDGLTVDYFDVVGTDYGVISCSDTFAITATVTNDRNEDVEDMKITFAIPELGYEVESEKFDLREGKTKTITFYGDLDMMKEEVPAGEYGALIGASDTDTVRNKYFPLMIQ